MTLTIAPTPTAAMIAAAGLGFANDAGLCAFQDGFSWTKAPRRHKDEWLRGWGEAAAAELRKLPTLAGLERTRRRLGFNFRALADMTRLPKTSVVNIFHRRGIKDPTWHIEIMVEALLEFLPHLDTARIPPYWTTGVDQISGTEPEART